MKRGQKRAAVGANDRRNDNEPLAARISAALDDHQYLQQIVAAAFETAPTSTTFPTDPAPTSPTSPTDPASTSPTSPTDPASTSPTSSIDPATSQLQRVLASLRHLQQTASTEMGDICDKEYLSLSQTISDIHSLSRAVAQLGLEAHTYTSSSAPNSRTASTDSTSAETFPTTATANTTPDEVGSEPRALLALLDDLAPCQRHLLELVDQRAAADAARALARSLHPARLALEKRDIITALDHLDYLLLDLSVWDREREDHNADRGDSYESTVANHDNDYEEEEDDEDDGRGETGGGSGPGESTSFFSSSYDPTWTPVAVAHTLTSLFVTNTPQAIALRRRVVQNMHKKAPGGPEVRTPRPHDNEHAHAHDKNRQERDPGDPYHVERLTATKAKTRHTAYGGGLGVDKVDMTVIADIVHALHCAITSSFQVHGGQLDASTVTGVRAAVAEIQGQAADLAVEHLHAWLRDTRTEAPTLGKHLLKAQALRRAREADLVRAVTYTGQSLSGTELASTSTRVSTASTTTTTTTEKTEAEAEEWPGPREVVAAMATDVQRELLRPSISLLSMIDAPSPTVTKVEDEVHTLRWGAARLDGLRLVEEIAYRLRGREGLAHRLRGSDGLVHQHPDLPGVDAFWTEHRDDQRPTMGTLTTITSRSRSSSEYTKSRRTGCGSSSREERPMDLEAVQQHVWSIRRTQVLGALGPEGILREPHHQRKVSDLLVPSEVQPATQKKTVTTTTSPPPPPPYHHHHNNTPATASLSTAFQSGGAERYLSQLVGSLALNRYLLVHAPGLAGPRAAWEHLERVAIQRAAVVIAAALGGGDSSTATSTVTSYPTRASSGHPSRTITVSERIAIKERVRMAYDALLHLDLPPRRIVPLLAAVQDSWGCFLDRLVYDVRTSLRATFEDHHTFRPWMQGIENEQEKEKRTETNVDSEATDRGSGEGEGEGVDSSPSGAASWSVAWMTPVVALPARSQSHLTASLGLSPEQPGLGLGGLVGWLGFPRGVPEAAAILHAAVRDARAYLQGLATPREFAAADLDLFVRLLCEALVPSWAGVPRSKAHTAADLDRSGPQGGYLDDLILPSAANATLSNATRYPDPPRLALRMGSYLAMAVALGGAMEFLAHISTTSTTTTDAVSERVVRRELRHLQSLPRSPSATPWLHATTARALDGARGDLVLYVSRLIDEAFDNAAWWSPELHVPPSEGVVVSPPGETSASSPPQADGHGRGLGRGAGAGAGLGMGLRPTFQRLLETISALVDHARVVRRSLNTTWSTRPCGGTSDGTDPRYGRSSPGDRDRDQASRPNVMVGGEWAQHVDLPSLLGFLADACVEGSVRRLLDLWSQHRSSVRGVLALEEVCGLLRAVAPTSASVSTSPPPNVGFAKGSSVLRVVWGLATAVRRGEGLDSWHDLGEGLPALLVAEGMLRPAIGALSKYVGDQGEDGTGSRGGRGGKMGMSMSLWGRRGAAGVVHSRGGEGGRNEEGGGGGECGERRGGRAGLEGNNHSVTPLHRRHHEGGRRHPQDGLRLPGDPSPGRPGWGVKSVGGAMRVFSSYILFKSLRVVNLVKIHCSLCTR